MDTRRVGSIFRGPDGRWLRVPVDGADVLVAGPEDTSQENARRSNVCRACVQGIRHSRYFHEKEEVRAGMRYISVTERDGMTHLQMHAYPVNEEDRVEDDHAPFLRPKETDSQLEGAGEWGDESQLVPGDES